MENSEIQFPDHFSPKNSKVHVKNEIDINAKQELVWAWLIHAHQWPDWYPNCKNVQIKNWGSVLTLGTEFTWNTFGLDLQSKVEEFVPSSRIAWSSVGFGVTTYHAWLITPTHTGCHVVTEETQVGFLAELHNTFLPTRMSDWHQRWLEALKVKAESDKLPTA